MNISRQHAKIAYNFQLGKLTLKRTQPFELWPQT